MYFCDRAATVPFFQIGHDAWYFELGKCIMEESSRKVHSVRGGLISLVLASAFAAPGLLLNICMLANVEPPARLMNNLGNFIFDWGLILILLILFCSIVGIIQGGRSRRQSLIALVILVLGIGLTLI